MERLDGDGSLHQLSFRRDDEVQVPEAHVQARDPADAVTSQPRPDVDVGRAKSLYLACQLSMFSDHRRVNLYLRVWLGWCARRTQGFYTGLGGTSLRPVCCCSCYRDLICSRGYKQARVGEDPKSLVKGVNGC